MQLIGVRHKVLVSRYIPNIGVVTGSQKGDGLSLDECINGVGVYKKTCQRFSTGD
jgi:hypothetical protein